MKDENEKQPFSIDWILIVSLIASFYYCHNFWGTYNQYVMNKIAFESQKISIHIFKKSDLVRKKYFFMYEKIFYPLFNYQRDLIQNCNSIQEADYLVMSINNYFRDKGYLALHWNKSFTDLVFSKPIIMMSEEDVTINRGSFNFKYKNNMTAVIGVSDPNDLNKFFGRNDCFSSMLFASYVHPHASSYDHFINRPFYVQTAISNTWYMVNSKRNEYLKNLMDVFGAKKVANYGNLFKNQNYHGNTPHAKMPPNAYFGFAMENSIAYKWITEKLFLTYRNDVIPIYRGHIKNREVLEQYGVNTEAFIDASNLSIPQLTSYLQSLIKDPKKMYEIYNRPLIKDKNKFDEALINGYHQCFNYVENRDRLK